MRTVTFYTTTGGKCPIRDFLDSLSAKAAQKVAWVLSLLEDLEVVPSTYFKKLSGTEGIWECRIRFGSNAYRLFCFFIDKGEVVITHGLVKKSRRIPINEIQKAEAYRKDFLKRRMRENNE
ncbi:TPA: type II toxin-antitoxin system RelE/ParE family toxin [Candidatus Poribacteria bacterium]|nr:type II toxin-antitoxin system RelE/ParE family toxin [Candidatus Poribacteria bacterium]